MKNELLFCSSIKLLKSEKSLKLLNEEKTITFVITKKLNKIFIKESMEKIFNVRVKKINICNYKKLNRKRKIIKFKKIYISLDDNFFIDIKNMEQK